MNQEPEDDDLEPEYDFSGAVRGRYYQRYQQLEAGMSTLRAELPVASIQNVTITEETLTVELSDGRLISVPLAWYPRLVHGTREERGNWRLFGAGEGIHWPELDEDISVENVIFGQPSGESQGSLARWLEKRSRG